MSSAASTTSGGKYIASIDVGTSSIRVIIFDISGNIIASHAEKLSVFTPEAGWLEQDPVEMIYLVSKCMSELLSPSASPAISVSDIVAAGITNQRETTIVWDSVTGEPLYNAIVWQDTRNKDTVSKLAETHGDGDKNCFRDRCGLPLSTYFSGTKLVWLRENVPRVREALARNSCKFGTVDSWIMYNLLGGQHLTDVTNASRTMLMNLETLQWDESLLKSFGIARDVLPEIVASSNDFGDIVGGGCNLRWKGEKIKFEMDSVSLTGCLGDQQAATVGQLCFERGSAKNTYGTGAFLIYNTGAERVGSRSGLLTTVLYQFELGDEGMAEEKSKDYRLETKHGSKYITAYALEGSVAVAGQISRWLQDNLGMVGSPAETSKFAEKVEDTGGVYFVTAFSGLFAPYWRDDVRGLITGLTMHTKREHICRAALEAVCHRTCEVVDAMQQDSKSKLTSLRVDGGMSQSDVMLDMQCELLQVPVIRPKMVETTALGAAIAAGLQVGFWKSLQDVKVKIAAAESAQKTFTPSEDDAIRQKVQRRRREWKDAVMKSMSSLRAEEGMNGIGAGSIRSEMKALTNRNSSTYTLFPAPGEDKKQAGWISAVKGVLAAGIVFGIGIAVGFRLKDIAGARNEKK